MNRNRNQPPLLPPVWQERLGLWGLALGYMAVFFAAVPIAAELAVLLDPWTRPVIAAVVEFFVNLKHPN
ncbi:hypothetical protein LHK_00380 [Laribacter hongkongensis HLHK9]|uniref:Uncharacterized protein n=1 Tax=Laribacter hongkongensis (strain HLHK9) TaxID=557598 RepID=C1DBH8_LARHH|nr:hypothetical protein [Laribacter hongkongensis]ACO73375.1 hypothetical protein LHK_00380 [Laribacter hongkongensis HLHK9]MCG9023977.1 hypothetical protein [Laribacter hongkongensis]